MRKFTLLLALLMFMGMQAVHAQNRVVTGKVTSASDGTALPGVTVLVKGTTNGTATNVKVSIPFRFLKKPIHWFFLLSG
jgi:hypothetical protein